MRKTRAQRRREERLKKKSKRQATKFSSTYDEALVIAVQKHIDKTNCPCHGSIGTPISPNEVLIICTCCRKIMGVLEGNKKDAQVQEEDH